MNSLNKYILITPSLLLISRCSSTKVHYETDKKYKPNRSFDIPDRKPRKPYIVIATLEVGAPRYNDGQFVFEKIRQKAQKIGEHAMAPIEHREIPEHTPVTDEPDYRLPGKPESINNSTEAYLKQPKVWGKANALRFTLPDKKPNKPYM